MKNGIFVISRDFPRSPKPKNAEKMLVATDDSRILESGFHFAGATARHSAKKQMPTKYHRLFGYCLLGGGAVLTLGSINSLYRMSWKGAIVRDILAPHLTSVPKAVNADDLNFTIQLSKDDAFKLWYFHASTKSCADAGSARARATAGMILMGIGVGLASNLACKTRKKKEAEQVAT